MPGTTPVYGFPYPEPTDLVADYPALGQDLAEDIEAVLPTLGGTALVVPTSIANSGGSATNTAGTVTFTGVTSISLNGVFTSTYQNYRAIIDVSSFGSTDTLRYRLRASGADRTGSVYSNAVYLYRSNNTAAGDAANEGADNAILTTTAATNGSGQFPLDIFSPQVASRATGWAFIGLNQPSGVNWSITLMGSGNYRTADSNDGFTLYRTASTLTGTIRVYGYKGA